jgi:hypothetical protein
VRPVSRAGPPTQPAPPPKVGATRAKYLDVVRGTDRAYELAQRHSVKLAWGTDILFDAGLATRQGNQLAKMKRWLTPAQVLKMATSTNAQLLAMENIDLLATPDTSLPVIMKDGVIHKNPDPPLRVSRWLC